MSKRYLLGNFPIGLIGENLDLTYPYEHLGTSSMDIQKLKDKNSMFHKQLISAENTMIIIGLSLINISEPTRQ